MKATLTPLLHALYRIDVQGRKNLPQRGPVILAANHRAFLDSVFLPLVVPRRVTFVAKAEYFDDPKSAWFFRSIGQIPIRREGGSASEGALLAAREVLARGEVFAIYPEGTRTRDGFMHRGHTGVARLALESGAPIVPVGLVGTDDIQPVGRRMPRLLKPVSVRFGSPIDARSRVHDAVDRMALRAIADEVMFELACLTGYEYVDAYATKQPEELAPVSAAPVDQVIDLAS